MCMKYVNFTNVAALSKQHGNIVKNVPMYKCDDIEQFFQDVDMWKRGDVVRDKFGLGATYVGTHSFVTTRNPFHNKRKKGPCNFYFVATEQLDKFVAEQTVFAMLAGKIKKAPKRVKRNIFVNNMGTTNSHYYANRDVKPDHLNCTIVTANTNIDEVIVNLGAGEK